MEMDQWARVRRKILIEGRSKRSVMAEEGLHWETLQKMLAHSRPPGYRRVRKRERKIDAQVEWIRGVLDRDREVQRKQRSLELEQAVAQALFLRAEARYEDFLAVTFPFGLDLTNRDRRRAQRSRRRRLRH